MNRGIGWALTLSGMLALADQNHSQYGHLSGQLRTFTLLEENRNPLHDYQATAIGGKLLYQSPSDYPIRLIVGVYTSRFLHDNLSSLSTEPLASNKNSRYAIGLVDTTDYDEESVTDIGEANLRYQSGKNILTLGRMKLDTPFVNAQDGRMIPTLVQGVWIKLAPQAYCSLQAGYINAFWNRNTPRWKSVEDALGYGYEMGNTPLETTTASNYYNNTSSDGLFIANLRYAPNDTLRVDLWDYYLENIFNLAYAEGSVSHILGSVELTYALQYLYQQQSGDGGNSEDNTPQASNTQKAKSYMQEGEESITYGVKTTLRHHTSRLSLAYNQTTDKGRFLFPREWGKEPLFTFQKRERSEGSGNCHAWMASLEHDFSNGWEMILSYGEYHKTDPKESKYNKYGFPSYTHYNIDLFYRFSGVFKGLKAEYLLTRKEVRGNTYQVAGSSEYNFIFRKNEMTLHNLILNYDF